MSIKISFDGWVNDVKDFSWGTVLKMSHDRRQKDDATGEWTTIGKDWLDVVVTDDQLAEIQGEKLIHVEGTLKAGGYIKNDGTAGADLKVTASLVQAIRRDEVRAMASSMNTVPSSWTPVADEDAPF